MKNVCFILLAIYFVGVSCERYEPATDNDVDETDTILNLNLKGTKWKAVGFVDMETGDTSKMMSEQPETCGEIPDCDTCHILTFVTETRAELFGCIYYWGTYSDYIAVIDFSPLIVYGRMTLMLFCCEDQRILPALYAFERDKYYTINSDELKLFYENKKGFDKFLLFKKLN